MNLAIIFPLALGAMVVFWLLSRRDTRTTGSRSGGGDRLFDDRVTMRRTIEAAKDPDLQRAIETGRAIDAIARMRELTGLGLKDAKDAVETIMRLRH